MCQESVVTLYSTLAYAKNVLFPSVPILVLRNIFRSHKALFLRHQLLQVSVSAAHLHKCDTLTKDLHNHYQEISIAKKTG